MTGIETMTGAARRWARHLLVGLQVPEAAEQDLWPAIFAGAEADQFTGLIVGPPVAGQSGPGEVTTGQQVFELDRGQVTDRYVTQRTEPGHLQLGGHVPGPVHRRRNRPDRRLHEPGGREARLPEALGQAPGVDRARRRHLPGRQRPGRPLDDLPVNREGMSSMAPGQMTVQTRAMAADAAARARNSAGAMARIRGDGQ
jgi:hypothetical protein